MSFFSTTDKRTLVSEKNRSEFPFNSVVAVDARLDPKTFVPSLGSGIIIGTEHILTAAHVVFNSNPQRPLESGRITLPETIASEVEQLSSSRLPKFDYIGESFNSMFDSITGSPIEGAKPVHRFLNRSTGAHLYTISEAEKNYVSDNLSNYSYENVAYYAYDTQQTGTTELYRFYNLNDDCHVYTTSISERDSMLSNDAVFRAEGDDGIAFYVESFDSSF